MRDRRRQLLFLFWVFPALVAAFGMHLVSVRYNPDLVFMEKLGAQLLIWMAWGVSSVVIFSICDRVPLARGSVLKSLAVLVPLSLVVVFVQIFVMQGVYRLYGLGPEHSFESTLFIGVRVSGDNQFVIFWAVVGAHAAFRWHDEWRRETVLAARLSVDLAQAQLHALKAQLNPHFLFNALNSVVALIGRDQAAAQRMVVRLADLLRTTLALSAEQEVPLSREIDLVRHYLEIEQIRFHDRLSCDISVENSALGALVPSLMIQPLVENSVVHGVSRLPGAGRIVVTARAEGSLLVVTVQDNGPGPFATPKQRGAGIGIANLRQRLERLYGDAAAMEISDAPGGGCLAMISLPLRALPAMA